MEIDRKTITSLPKIELHLHLDCSLSLDVVQQLRPNITEDEYHKNFIAPEKCIDLADALKCASSGIEIMQTEQALRAVVKDLFLQLQRDHVIYAEIRFAPLLHLSKGLLPEEAVEIVAESVNDSIFSTGIMAGIILCTLRHFNEEQSLQTGRLRLFFQILCRVWVNVKNMVEADQINPMKATMVMGPRAKMMSSKFLPNKRPIAGAKNSNLFTIVW
ncbi:MAG: hypothetical protein MUO76_21075 [Anaerolineaceae bacterium]|nr:hypothetical protein [Anaerolineaceae bacterium]